jgi:hypothetical protein
MYVALMFFVVHILDLPLPYTGIQIKLRPSDGRATQRWFIKTLDPDDIVPHMHNDDHWDVPQHIPERFLGQI